MTPQERAAERERLVAYLRSLPEAARQDLRTQLQERIGYHLDAGCSPEEAVERGWEAFQASVVVP